ncbi:MAG: outer membrane protein assembly factor BamB [Pseudomonadales bacterium]|nr:outer membrane protein assembly factor BamB [Pseudomonadales bacterium]
MRFKHLALLAMGVGALLLAACSSDKPKEIKPNPLPKMGKSSVTIHKIWSFRIGDGNHGRFLLLRPAVSASQIFVASSNGTLEAHDRGTGHRQWRVHSHALLSVGVESAYGVVLIGTMDGRLLAYASKDGHALWTASLASAPMAEPLVAAETIYVSCNDGRLYALDRLTGKIRWSVDSSVPSLSLHGMAKPLLVDGTLVMGTGDGRLLAFNAKSGDPLWDTHVIDSQGRTELERMNDVDGDLGADADTLYAVSYHGGLAAIDPDNGRHRWDYRLSSWQGVALGIGNVFVVEEDSVIEAVDVSTGKSVWKQSDLRGRRLTAPIQINGMLLVADFQGWVHVASALDGHWVGRYHFYRTDGFQSPPVVDGSDIYLQSEAGRVIGLTLQKSR